MTMSTLLPGLVRLARHPGPNQLRPCTCRSIASSSSSPVASTSSSTRSLSRQPPSLVSRLRAAKEADPSLPLSQLVELHESQDPESQTPASYAHLLRQTFAHSNLKLAGEVMRRIEARGWAGEKEVRLAVLFGMEKRGAAWAAQRSAQALVQDGVLDRQPVLMGSKVAPDLGHPGKGKLVRTPRVSRKIEVPSSEAEVGKLGRRETLALVNALLDDRRTSDANELATKWLHAQRKNITMRHLAHSLRGGRDAWSWRGDSDLNWVVRLYEHYAILLLNAFLRPRSTGHRTGAANARAMIQAFVQAHSLPPAHGPPLVPDADTLALLLRKAAGSESGRFTHGLKLARQFENDFGGGPVKSPVGLPLDRLGRREGLSNPTAHPRVAGQLLRLAALDGIQASEEEREALRRGVKEWWDKIPGKGRGRRTGQPAGAGAKTEVHPWRNWNDIGRFVRRVDKVLGLQLDGRKKGRTTREVPYAEDDSIPSSRTQSSSM